MASKRRHGSWHEYDVVVERNVVTAMRDGIRLAADIYRPARDGAPVDARFPAIVERTPYDKHSPRFVAQARFFAQHGYVVVIQDVRGRGESEGEWYPFAREAADGYASDTILSAIRRGGSTQAPQVRASATSWRFDPCDPVPTIGGNISVGFEFMPTGGFDQRTRAGAFGANDTLPLVVRADVVAYVSDPLETRSRGDRPSRREPLGVIIGSRYRLYCQAY